MTLATEATAVATEVATEAAPVLTAAEAKTAAKRAAYAERLAGIELMQINRAKIEAAAVARAEAAKAAAEAAKTAAERAAKVSEARAEARAEATAKAAAAALAKAEARAAERAAAVSIRGEMMVDIMAKRAAARDLSEALDRMQYTLHPKHAAAVKTAAGDVYVAAMLGATEAEAAELAAEAAAVDMAALVTEAEESVSSGSQFGRFITAEAKAQFHGYRATAGYALAAEALATLKESAVIVSSSVDTAGITVYATERATSPEQFARRIGGASGRVATAEAAAAKARAEGLTEAAAKATARATRAASALEALRTEAAEAAAKPATGGMATWKIMQVAKWSKATAAKAAKLAPAADNNGMRAMPSISGSARISDKTARAAVTEADKAAAKSASDGKTMTAAERMRKMRAAKRAAEGVTVRAYNSATGTNSQAGKAKAKTAISEAMAEAVALA